MIFLALEAAQVVGGCQQELAMAKNTKWYTHYDFAKKEPAYKPYIFDDDWTYTAPDSLDTVAEEIAEELDGDDKDGE